MLGIVCSLMQLKNLQKELKFTLLRTRWLIQNHHSFKPLKRVEKFFFLQWAESHAPGRVTIHMLNDAMGPAPVHQDADCIVATPETRGQCESINAVRASNGLAPLNIIEVAHMQDIEGGIISSSRIRNGHIDLQGHSWIESHYREQTLLMHPRLDEELKTPMGVLFEGPEDAPEVAMFAALDGLDLSTRALVAVGDVTVATLLNMDYVPDIALIDGQTKRTPLAKEEQVDGSRFPSHLRAVNKRQVCLQPLSWHAGWRFLRLLT